MYNAIKKDTNKIIKTFYNSNKTSQIINIYHKAKFIKMILIKYKINIKYIIGTSLMNKSLKYIKNLYYKRWNIELVFF